MYPKRCYGTLCRDAWLRCRSTTVSRARKPPPGPWFRVRTNHSYLPSAVHPDSSVRRFLSRCPYRFPSTCRDTPPTVLSLVASIWFFSAACSMRSASPHQSLYLTDLYQYFHLATLTRSSGINLLPMHPRELESAGPTHIQLAAVPSLVFVCAIQLIIICRELRHVYYTASKRHNWPT